jgi:hypothetical protein
MSRAAVASLLLSITLGCSASAEKDPGGAQSRADAGGGEDAPVVGPVAEGGLDLDGAIEGGNGGPIGPGGTMIFGHDERRLYSVDPKTLATTDLGAFAYPGQSGIAPTVTDLAIDKNGVMYTVTTRPVLGAQRGALYRIDYTKSPPVATKLANLDTAYNGLTFVPEGMIEEGREILIGIASDGGWWRLDVDPSADDAKATKLGEYGGGHTSSGDAVGIIGDAVYATTKLAGATNDHIVVVDPKTGAVKKDLGEIGVGAIYGLGYWGGVLYGFTGAGKLYEMKLDTMTATEVTGTPRPRVWNGAGVTTSAPVIIR